MKHFSALLFLLLPFAAQAQIGGRAAFQSLSLPPSAHLAALGGMTASARSADPTQFLASPALLYSANDHAAAASYVAYVADIKQSTLAYAFNTQKRGRFGLGLSYLNYGSNDSYDDFGNYLGTFAVNEYVLAAADSYTKGKLTFGLTAKLAISSIAGNRALALAGDAGVLYKPREDQDFTVGLAVRNAGGMLVPYVARAREPLPLDVQLGTTIKPEHMPLRFTFTAHHLQQWTIQYIDPNATSTNAAGDTVRARKNFGDNLARHLTVGAELLLGQGLSLRAGYNHLQARELRLDNVGAGAGFSFGAMVRISQFQLDYTYATLQAAGSSNYITLSRSFDNLFTKPNP